MNVNKITIATDGWNQSDIDQVCNIFPSDVGIERKNLAQFVSGIELAIVIGVAMGSGVLGGFSGAIGTDIWNKLKEKFSQRAKQNKHSSIGFEISTDTSTAHFNLKTEEPALVERAFDTINAALKQVGSDETTVEFYFDNEKGTWLKIVERSFSRKVKGVAASTTPVKKGDKTIQLTVEELKNLASQMPNTPLTLGHGGKQIGKITKAWVEGDKLMYEAGIYDGISEKENEALDKLIKNAGGVSIGFKY